MGPVVYMLATKVFVGLLGILLAFAPDAIYDFYERQPGYWGLSPGTDQAVGGLIMALEQSIVMGVALVFLFIRALSESEREDKRAERLEDDAEAAADAARRAADAPTRPHERRLDPVKEVQAEAVEQLAGPRCSGWYSSPVQTRTPMAIEDHAGRWRLIAA